MSSSRWFRTSALKPSGVVVVAHGLNLKPEKMDQLSILLQNKGFDVLRLALSGLDGNLDEFKAASFEKWESEFLKECQEAAARATETLAPLLFVGFSTGATLGLCLMNDQKSGVKFKKMVLFAPAVSIRKFCYLVKFFNIFGHRFCLPSASPIEYRANSCTPMAVYNAFFKALKKVRQSRCVQANVPTLIFIDSKDELVSFNGVRNFIIINKLSLWRLIQLQKVANTQVQRIRHLIIDKDSLGPDLWDEVIGSVVSHFSSDKTISA